MGLFGNDKNSTTKNGSFLDDEDFNSPDHAVPAQLTVEQRAEALRENAIQYIIELDDKSLDTFIESAKLIREGYRKLNVVKTEDEKQAEKEAREAEKQAEANADPDKDLDAMLDDELESAFLDEDAPSRKGKTTRRR